MSRLFDNDTLGLLTGITKGMLLTKIAPVLMATIMALAAGAFAGAAPDKLDLNRVLQTALANSSTVKQAEAALEKAQARLDQRSAGHLPSVNVAAKYSRIAPDPSMSFPGFGSFQFSPENSYDCHVDVTERVFDFGKTTTEVSVGKWGVREAQRNLESARELVEFQSLELFYGVLLAREEMRLQEDGIAALKEYLELTVGDVKAGAATEFDVLGLNVKLSEAQSSRVDKAGELRKRLLDLAAMLGLDDVEGLEVEGELSAGKIDVDESRMVAQGIENNLALKIALAHEEGCREQVLAVKRRNLPVIAVGVEAGAKNGYYPDMDLLKGNVVGFVQLDMPLFNPAAGATVREAEADLASASAQRRDTREKIVATIRRAMVDLSTSLDSREAAMLNVHLADESMEQAKVRYGGGMTTGLTLLNARADRSRAGMRYAQAVYECIMSQAALKRAAGIPLVSDTEKRGSNE